MSEKPLVMISTQLTPGACGIGTHSLVLRKHWPGAGQSFEFLVNEGSAECDGLADADHVAEFRNRPQQLARELERIGAADVLLHYAGRAYHRFGAPLWMPGVLKQWKRRFPAARLMIFFHELPAKFPITSRHFWLGELNGLVVRRLSRIADVLVTNTEQHAANLRNLSRRADIHLIPIASNIERVEAAEPRQNSEFVIFGLSFGRLQVVQAFAGDVPRWHRAGRLTKLHIVGPRDDVFSAEADRLMSGWPASIEVTRHGMLASAEVSRVLQRAAFALTNVTNETWSKSSAFIACATHGCAVVVRGERGEAPPLSHTVAASEVESISDIEVERRTSALAAWAAENASWPAIAARMAFLLRGGNATHVG